MAGLQDIILLTRDLAAFFLAPGVPQWGIFIDGAPAIEADSVVTFEYSQDARISNYQVEEGSFESYNKVDTPFDVRVRYAAGGSEANRQALLETAQAIMKSLELFDVVSPEAVYTGCNPVRMDYRRTNVNGVGLLQVDIALEEVRVTATSTFSNAKTADGADAVGGGNVLPREPSVGEKSLLPEVQ